MKRILTNRDRLWCNRDETAVEYKFILGSMMIDLIAEHNSYIDTAGGRVLDEGEYQAILEKMKPS